MYWPSVDSAKEADNIGRGGERARSAGLPAADNRGGILECFVTPKWWS